MKRSGVTDGPASGWIVIDAFFYLADAIITVRSLIHRVWIT